MKYLEWNNLIGSCILNEKMAGRETYLFLTKQDIIKAGKTKSIFKSQDDESVWNDFIQALRVGIPGGPRKCDLLEKIYTAYDKRKSLRIDEVEILYPPYVGYLILTTLPILESTDSEKVDTLRANNYYTRINNFLKKYRLSELQNQNNNRNWKHIWDHLSDWSVHTKKTDLGIFRVRNFSPAWKYAGIPLSQCLIDPKAFKRLPSLFLKEGLVPNSSINDRDWRSFLEKTWGKDLQQRSDVLEHIQKENDEMGRVVLELVKQAYHNWKGEIEGEEELTTQQPVKRIRKEGTRSRLFLSFKLDRSSGEFKWGCRMFSRNDYPEDLSFNGQACFEARENWSNQLEFSFVEKTTLKDLANKWEAVLPEKDLRFFIGGAHFNLSADYWIETDEINRISPMRILCKNAQKSLIEKWGKHFSHPGKFKEFTSEDYDGIPKNQSLFEFQYPLEFPSGEQIKIEAIAKRILLINGVKLGTRTYLKNCLPDVVVENGDGSEEVFLELCQGVNKVPLEKKSTDVIRWMLPQTLKEGDEFIISLEGAEKTYPFRIASEPIELLKIENQACPKRNRFGLVTDNENECFVQGSLVHGLDYKKQGVYEWHFKPGQRNTSIKSIVNSDYNIKNDLLLEFLTRKKTAHLKEFFEAFEQNLYSKISNELEDEKVNLTFLKRQIVNWYDFLGYVDFDYLSKRITVNPPQMFLVPTPYGRKAILTGGRTPDFVDRIFETSNKLGLQIEITPQAGAEKPWILLPNTIIINAFDLQGYGISELNTFAEKLNIYFAPEQIVQWGLLNFSAGISDYEKSIHQDERFEDWDWSRKIFNPDTFRFERCELDTFDKTFSLVEYQLNAYTYRHILWKDGYAFPVDKSWGRWLVLKHFEKKVIFKSANCLTAIPTGMPLPRLMSEALLLLSGKIPKQKLLEINGIRTYFNLYDNLVDNMSFNEFSKIGQTLIQVNQNF